MLTCPDFQTKTTPWRKGGELFTAYKQKGAVKTKQTSLPSNDPADLIILGYEYLKL